jgi:uncharacterized protein
MAEDVKVAHFPGLAPVEAYGRGGFRFADMSHRGSILCLPTGIFAWHPVTPADLTATSAYERVFALADALDFCLIGTGPEIGAIPERLRWRFRELGIQADTMSTGAAVRTYNVMLAEGRRVAAGLLAVD